MKKAMRLYIDKRDLARDVFGLLVMVGLLLAALAVRCAIFLPEYL